jgi:hypothetical protein
MTLEVAALYGVLRHRGHAVLRSGKALRVEAPCVCDSVRSHTVISRAARAIAATNVETAETTFWNG